MLKKWISTFLSVIMILSCVPFQAFAAEPASAIADVQELKAALENGTGDYELTADIVATDWVTPTQPFNGTLNGNGHKITGLSYNRKNGTSGMLLNEIGANGKVINLKLESTVESKSDAGALAASNAGVVENVHLVGGQGIYGGQDPNVGGIVGVNTGIVSQCSVQGTLEGVLKGKGNGKVGGIVGYNRGGHVDQCFNADAVTSATMGSGVGYAGGIVGMNDHDGTVSHCYNRGEISKGTQVSSGIVGFNKGLERADGEGFCVNSYHAGTVLGGGNNLVISKSGTITNCYYMEGENSGQGKDAQFVNAEDQTLADGLNAVSNFFTIDNGVLKLLWETGVQPDAPAYADKSALNTAVEEALGMTQGEYTDETWGTFLAATEAARRVAVYPYSTEEQISTAMADLDAARQGLQTPEPQPGDPDGPQIEWTEVGTAEELKKALVNGGNIKLTADITLPSDWVFDSYKPFTLEGAGHTVTLSGRAFIATPMFGTFTESNLYKNCTIANVVFAGEVKGEELNGFGGAVAGTSEGTIRNCINLAEITVKNMSNAGGFAGTNKGTITNCVGYGAVTGGLSNNGALAGNNQGTITGSYAAADLADEQNQAAALETLNAAKAENDQTWKLEGGKLTFGPAVTPDPENPDPENPDPEIPGSSIVEISNQSELEAALYNAYEGDTSVHAGKKLIITADFEISGEFRFPPKGLNTVLDGQGHTITLKQALPVMEEIAADGVVMNLGVTGSIKGGASGSIANKCAGKIINCWSDVKINRTDAGAIGGLVGVLEATGVIDNCYVAVEAKGLLAKVPQNANGVERRLVGPLVGNAYEGCTIKNSYWAENMAEDGNQVATPYSSHLNEYLEEIPYEAPGCSVKTLDAMKSSEFVTLMNQNRGEAMGWVAGNAGLPVHGDPAPLPEVSKTALESKLNEVKDLNEADYTAETWTVFAAARANAQKVMDDANADQKAVDAALNELTQAQTQLAKKPADLTVVEIATAEEFYNALVEVWEPGKVPAQDGKKLVITADFTIPYESFRLPKGLNTLLDGQGHTITLDKMSLVDEIGPKGVIANLGIAGSAEGGNTGAITANCSGTIVNCWSTAMVKNESTATIGGLVGTLHETGRIDNCFLAPALLKGKNVGAAVGTVRPGSVITNCYWVTGAAENVYFRALDDMNEQFEYTGASDCSVKTEEELKAPEFLALLNANRGEYMQWNRSESGLPYFGENIVPMDIIEIATQADLEAALADIYEDPTMSGQEGRKLVITADFTVTGTTRFPPKGLNTVLDGQGHTITLDGSLPVIDEIGPKGVVCNLGIAGTVKAGDITGSLASKCAGVITNCRSTAMVENQGNNTIGGLVGMLLETGKIENSFVAALRLTANSKKVGPLVGTVRPGSTITNCYWLNGMASTQSEKAYFRALDDLNMKFDYTGDTNCSVKTEQELKAPEFLALLNANRGSGMEWSTGADGYPSLNGNGGTGPIDPQKDVEITLTYNTGKTVKFLSSKGLTIDPWDIMGMSQVGNLTCEGGAHWSIDYDTWGKNIMVADQTGSLFVYGEGRAVVSVSNESWEKIASFTLTVPVSVPAYAMRLTSAQGEMVDGVLTIPGRTTVSLIPQLQRNEGDEWVDADPLRFTFKAPKEAAEVVNNGVSAIKPGRFTVTCAGMGMSASIEMESTFVPISAIRPAPSGTYKLHDRQAMVFEGDANFLDLNLSHQTGSVIIDPPYASNQGKNAYEFTFSDPDVAFYMTDFVMGIVPKKAGKTDVTVTTLLEENNVSGTTSLVFEYFNPLTSIDVPETVEIRNGVPDLDLPLVFHSEKEAEGYHVSEPAIDWTFSSTDGGEIQITRDAKALKIEDGREHWVANYHYKVEGVNPGTVTVTGTPRDTTGGAKPITFKVVVTGEVGPTIDYVKMAKDDIAGASKWVIADQNGSYNYPSEWAIFSLLRSGTTAQDAGFDVNAYLDSVEKEFSGELNFTKMKPTELARVSLVLSMLGQDLNNFRGINFVDLMVNNKFVENGSNEAAWILIALDTVGYEIPEGSVWTREKLIDTMLSFECKDGGFSLFAGGNADIDMTGMVTQALAPYTGKGDEAVDNAVARAVAYLSKVQSADGGYGSPEATAQVLVALSMLHIDPLDNANGFVKGRKNLISYMHSYKNEDGGFCHTKDTESNNMATQQVLYSLEGFLRFHENRNGLYDFTDLFPKPEVPEADKAKLEAAIAAAKDLNQDSYKILSWKKVASELDAAEKVMADAKASQETVDAAVKSLNAAVKNLQVLDPIPAFTDYKNHWGKKDIEFAVENGLFKGIDQTTFGPNRHMTRGMFVTVLGRMAGVDPNGSGKTQFKDVPADEYFAPYIAWAVECHITEGMSADTFEPNREVTREQMATFLSRFCKNQKIELVHKQDMKFVDADQIHDWAEDSVREISGAGLLVGDDLNQFRPRSFATRAEVATLLARLVRAI